MLDDNGVFFGIPFHTETLTFRVFCNKDFNFFIGSLLGARPRREKGLSKFCYKQISHDEISIQLPLFPLQHNFASVQLSHYLFLSSHCHCPQ